MAIDGLMAGYQHFVREDLDRYRARWHELAQGQSPTTMIIACSDSRVDPATIFQSRPGEIFAVRNIANIVPPATEPTGHNGVSAAIEFAVTQLEVSDIMVMGHGACGGCAAAMTHVFDRAAPGEGGYIDRWLDLVTPTRDAVTAAHGAQAFTEMEHAVVRMSLANLASFPWVQSRVAAGKLTLHGAWFSIAGGKLHLLDQTRDQFEPVT